MSFLFKMAAMESAIYFGIGFIDGTYLESVNLSVDQISIKYINSRLSYYYFRFRF